VRWYPGTELRELRDGKKLAVFPSSPCQRHGVTLTECLAVLLCIGILIGLLLPAVHSARETARRAQCQMNLQQIGLALRNYETLHTVLPAGTVENSGPVSNIPLGFHHSWTVAILPWLDPPAGAHVRYDQSVYSPRNLQFLVSLGRTPSVYTCPSGLSFASACADYAGCHDDRDKPIDEDDHGVFFRNSAVRSVEIPDGTAHMIFVGEKPRYGWEWGWMSGTRATLRTTAIPIPQMLELIERQGNDGAPPMESAQDLIRMIRPDVWLTNVPFGDDVEAAFSQASKVPELPEDPKVVEELQKFGEIPEGRPIIGGFGSEHPGVTNFLFGDMSVRPVWHQIDPKVLRSLGNRLDGEGILESLQNN